ncbi:MAG: FAD:protein FMN transferase [Desulfovibrionaceae bacterium]|nr:FAD:protein FMN transferase [Desulfovibrionaceae bacterium]
MKFSFSRRSFLSMAGLIGTGLCFGLPRIAQASERRTETRLMLGTFVTLTVASVSEMQAEEALGKTFEEISHLEKMLSRYQSRSALSVLNDRGKLTETPDELLTVLKAAANMHRLSTGGFDISVAPAADFLKKCAARGEIPPSAEQELLDRLALVDASCIHINGRTVVLEREGMQLTLDGIAKGYIADRAASSLRRNGIRHAIVNAGGDIMACGSREDGLAWNIGLQSPAQRNQLVGTIGIHNGAIATSGTYEQFYNESHTKSHLISLRGKQNTVSATVTAPTTMMADALATACCVLPVTQAVALADAVPGCACLLIEADGSRHRSSLWNA